MNKKTLSKIVLVTLALSTFIPFQSSAQTTATLALSPTSTTVGLNQTFNVSVVLNTGGGSVTAVDIFKLHFNPSILQVVDSDGATAGVQITPGTVLPNTVNNSADNSAGTIQFAQDAGGGSNSISSGGTIATITFRGIGSGTSAVTFDFTAGSTSDTNIAYQGADRLASVTNASFTVDATAPSTPASLTATVASSTQINLSWSASTDNVGVTGYQIERCSGSPTCSNFALLTTTSGTGTTYNNTSLSTGTDYRYRVRATDAMANLSGYSPIATAATSVNFDFTMSNAGNRSVTQGSAIANTITATIAAGSAQAVTFSVSGLPSGVTSSFSAGSCSPTCATTLTLTASASATVGNATITVTGTAGSLVKTTTYTLTVNLGNYQRTINLASLEGLSGNAITGTLNVLNSSSVLIKAFGFTTNTAGSATITFDIPPQVAYLQVRATPFLSRRISQDLNINTTYNFPQLLTGDINQDTIINSVDYSVLNTNWFTTNAASDLNKDGLVNSIDYSYMNKNWLQSGE